MNSDTCITVMSARVTNEPFFSIRDQNLHISGIVRNESGEFAVAVTLQGKDALYWASSGEGKLGVGDVFLVEGNIVGTKDHAVAINNVNSFVIVARNMTNPVSFTGETVYENEDTVPVV